MRNYALSVTRPKGIALEFEPLDEAHDRALDGEVRREVLRGRSGTSLSGRRHGAVSS